MNDSTQEKILEVASKLFAEQGLEGTSIREIAREAQVNLAAINYHFKSKENLYFEVFAKNMQWMEEGVSQIALDRTLDTREFSSQLYLFFVQNSEAMMNSFKILLTNKIDFSQVKMNCGEGETFGPPGSKYMLEIIRRDVGDKVTNEQCHWAMRMIFSSLVHFGVMAGTSFFKTNCELMPYMSPDQKKKDIYQLVESLLNNIKNVK